MFSVGNRSLIPLDFVQSRVGLPNGIQSACTWGPHKNAELHIHNEGINNKCALNATS